MSFEPFDALARPTAAGLSRRGSLLALGGAMLATAVSGPGGTKAAKSGKKARKRARKKARKLCRRQVGQCEAFLAEACGDQACVELLQPCCASFARCNASTALQCIFDPEPPDEA